jgi:hypothetical protein
VAPAYPFAAILRGRGLNTEGLSVSSPPGSGSGENGSGYEQELLASLRAELQEERSRKSSLETRSFAVAAAAGTATTLLLGLGSTYRGHWQVAFFSLLLAGGVLFLLAAIFGWMNSRLRVYPEIDPEEFDELLNEGFEGGADAFRLYMAKGALDALRGARSNNDEKAEAFTRALVFLVGGAGIVTLELIVVLVDRIRGPA